jgi:maleate isomerase
MGSLIRWFYEVVPEGVELLEVNLGMLEHTDDQVERAMSYVDDAARRLAESGANLIQLGGTPFGLKSLEWNRQLVKRIEEVSKLPASTTLINALDALTALSAKKIIIATPFEEELNRRHEEFWTSNGFEVVNIKGLGIRRHVDIRRLPTHAPYTLAKEAYLETPEVDAIYLPCAPFSSPAVVECLEKDLGKPVVASTQAAILSSLKALGIKEAAKGYGRLFELL